MELYTFPISPNGKRVRIAASELGIALDLKNVDFAAGENRAPDYLALNPTGKAPVLTDGDFALWESSAIICYLAETKPGTLWPDDLQARADTMRWMFFCSCHVDPYFTTLVVERFIKARRGAPEDEAQSKAAEVRLARFVPVIEGQLGRAPYIAGQFGLGDIVLGCTLELSPMVRHDLAPYPRIRAWLDRLQSRPSWR
ncbi:MAG TPA: glutathione S-transferase family protein [Stellaceae bacterium]